jgi:hypothetical protein
MAIIDQKEIISSNGIKKEIDKNSTSLALDILQRGLYAFPIQSTVRELASNAYDAIKERDVAKSIISGETDIEDHFDVTKNTDGIYTDSGFDADYFDLQWLSDDPKAYIFYEEGKQKDTLRIVDNGVGLGQKRLVGYFQLNYSTKRTNKDALGKWGLGSKVALALGVDSFRVITRYNGKKFKFDVFLDKVESVISKFGDNGMNEEIILKEKIEPTYDDKGKQLTEGQEEYIAYCEDTTEKNGLEIIVDIKKHNKQKFFDAIRSQLMYMPDIKFMHRAENKMSHEHVDIQAKVLYRDNDIILSESTIYNKPHILLGTGKALINYGFVAFNELEIEPKGGAVGLILDINDIEVTPSREAPVWSTRTRDAVLKKYTDVTATATKLVEAQLKQEKDYMKWLATAASTMHALKYGNTGDNDSVVSRLASIIDVQAISNLRFPGDGSIAFKNDDKAMFGDFITAWEVKYNSYEKKIERKKVKDLGLLNKPVYFVADNAKGLVDRYLFEEEGVFIQVRLKEGAGKNKYAKHVLASTMKDYSTVVVPQDRLDIYESEDLTEEEENTVVANVAAKNRKLNQEIVIHKLQSGSSSHGRHYSFFKQDEKISNVFSLNQGSTCLYSVYGERDYLHQVLEMLPSDMLTCEYSRIDEEILFHHIGDKRRVNAMMVAAENKKYLASSNSFTQLDKFIVDDYDEEEGKVMFSKHIKLAASFAFVREIVRENYHKVVEELNKEQFKYVHKFDYKTFVRYVEPWQGSYGPKRLATQQPWYKDCIKYHAGQLGLIELDEDASDNLLEEIENNIPDILCDRISDEIKEVDILDKDVIEEILNLIKYYGPVSTLIKNIGGGYYSDSTEKEQNAKKVAILCKMLNENPELIDEWDFPNYFGEKRDDE